ncbi:MAG TPA: 4,5-dihydroxyphthalate dehydrogenase [Armatimonadetes bacterium]|jgi:predicted dehydrogenase|nr:4,5-dihydroxyphthalate dehydrogenase [Armatimonadota bacterium]
MDKVGIGVVGLGWAASGHMLAFKANSGCEVGAVCTSKDLSESQVLEMTGSAATVYHDFDQMLADNSLDAIDICTPHWLHPEQTIKAAEAGKHVMIEKPLALDYDSLVAMRNAINAAGVFSTVYFELRFIPHYQLVKSAMAQGLLGDVHHFEVDYYHGIGPWYGQYEWNIKKEKGGSALLTAGVHALDGLLYFANREVDEVFAYSTKSSDPAMQAYEYDTTSTAIIKFADGTTGKCVSCIDCRQPYVFNVKLVGSAGTLWNDRMWTTKIAGLRPGEWMQVPTAQAESGDVLDHPYPPQVDEFVECVKGGKDSSVNFEAAFGTHRVVFAIEKSLEENRPVRLSEMTF